MVCRICPGFCCLDRLKKVDFMRFFGKSKQNVYFDNLANGGGGVFADPITGRGLPTKVEKMKKCLPTSSSTSTSALPKP